MFTQSIVCSSYVHSIYCFPHASFNEATRSDIPHIYVVTEKNEHHNLKRFFLEYYDSIVPIYHKYIIECCLLQRTGTQLVYYNHQAIHARSPPGRSIYQSISSEPHGGHGPEGGGLGAVDAGWRVQRAHEHGALDEFAQGLLVAGSQLPQRPPVHRREPRPPQAQPRPQHPEEPPPLLPFATAAAAEPRHRHPLLSPSAVRLRRRRPPPRRQAELHG